MASEAGENAIIVRGIDTTEPNDWIDLFTSSADLIGGFVGDEENAALLMAKFGVGREFIKSFFADKVEVTCSDIWIMHEEVDGIDPDIFYFRSEDRLTTGLVVKKAHLETFSFIEPHDVVTTTRVADGQQGQTTPADHFLLAGSEEAHHSIFYALNPDTDERDEKERVVSRGEYHAVESEWQALAFQILIAKELGVSTETMDDLVCIQQEAAKIRLQQGLGTEVSYLP